MKKLPIFKISSKKRLDILLGAQTFGLVWAACSATSDLYSKALYPQVAKEIESQVTNRAGKTPNSLGRNNPDNNIRPKGVKLIKFPKNIVNAYCPNINLKLVGCAIEILVPSGLQKNYREHSSLKKGIEKMPPKTGVLEEVQLIANFLGEISEHNRNSEEKRWDIHQFQGAFVRSSEEKLLFVSSAEIYQSYLIQNALKIHPGQTLSVTYRGILGQSRKTAGRPAKLLGQPLGRLCSQLKTTRRLLCYLTHNLLEIKTKTP